MATQGPLSQIISKLQDQRYLFYLGAVIVGASLSRFQLGFAIAIVVGALLLVFFELVSSLLLRLIVARPANLYLTVALDFGDIDPSTVSLVQGECQFRILAKHLLISR